MPSPSTSSSAWRAWRSAARCTSRPSSSPEGVQPTIRNRDFTVATIGGHKVDEEAAPTVPGAPAVEGAAPAAAEGAAPAPADAKAPAGKDAGAAKGGAAAKPAAAAAAPAK